LKGLISKIFGFDTEIQNYKLHIKTLNHQIEKLSWDTVFGMWTRNAFVQICSVMPRGKRVVVFLDLNDMHELNHRHGYTEMDKRIRAVFSIPFRRSDIVARWYSGDEIVILFDSDIQGAKRKIEELIRSADMQGLSFQYKMCIWEVGKIPIAEIVNILSNKLSCQTTGS